MIQYVKFKEKFMEKLDEIIDITKKVYKKSIVNDYVEIEDDLLSIITLIDRFKHNLSNPKKPTIISRSGIDDIKYKDMACIAYVLSECGHKVFNDKATQLEVIENLATILRTKPLTLRNIRDYLDTYTNSTREGWKKPLPDRLQFVFDACRKLSCEEATAKAKDILYKYEKR